MASRKPVQVAAADYFSTGAANLGTAPFGQHYRYKAPVIGVQFEQLNSFPIISVVPGSKAAAKYHQAGEYEHAFKSRQLGDWTIQAWCSDYVDRGVPQPTRSVYAGANIEG